MKRIILMLSLLSLMGCGSKNEGKIVNINKAQYLEKVYNYVENPKKFVFKGDKPAVVDFYAVWCPPCKKLEPFMEKMAKKYSGEIDFYKIDVDKEMELSLDHRIKSIPTMIFYPKKGQPYVLVGLVDEAQIEEALQKILNSK